MQFPSWFPFVKLMRVTLVPVNMMPATVFAVASSPPAAADALFPQFCVIHTQSSSPRLSFCTRIPCRHGLCFCPRTFLPVAYWLSFSLLLTVYLSPPFSHVLCRRWVVCAVHPFTVCVWLMLRKMFIGGLSWQTAPEGLREYFSKFGDITEVMVMKDPTTRRSRGFGFVTFADPSSVDKVLTNGPHELDGKKIDPKIAFPKRAHPKLVTRTKKVFVGGLSAPTTLEDVKNYFQQFGRVSLFASCHYYYHSHSVIFCLLPVCYFFPSLCSLRASLYFIALHLQQRC